MPLSTSVDRDTRRSLDTFFTDTARRHSENAALFASGRYWSYGELDAASVAIEEALDLAAPSANSRNIGLAYGGDMFSYAAVIAIMRSGHVYVPLNPKMPAAKLMRVLEDAGIEAIVVDPSEPLSEGVVGLLAGANPLKIIAPRCEPALPFQKALRDSTHTVWYAWWTSVSESTDENAIARRHISEQRRSSSHLAYIIYTSGSTGAPKGVPITHESACACIEKSHEMFGTSEQDRFTEFSALSFDVSILDLFLCWKSGGTLYVPQSAEAMVPFAFVVKHQITVWSSVPSLANFLLMLRLLRPNALPTVRRFLFCGEALPVELARACLAAAPHARLFNLYGPTECTIFATCHEYSREGHDLRGTVPIGASLPGVRCRIVDEGRIVEADDEPGELWLAGDQLACGYWNNPIASSAAFVSVATKDGEPEI